MSTGILRPNTDEYAPYYHAYICKVNTDDLIGALEAGQNEFIQLLQGISADKLDYRYQEGKWSIKEVLIHQMDVERIFTCRALRFSRNDRTSLPGFDEDQYVPEANAAERSLDSLIDEYTALRRSTIQFFKNISPEMSLRTGIANGKEISVRALGFIIPGHELHHMQVIKERYL